MVRISSGLALAAAIVLGCPALALTPVATPQVSLTEIDADGNTITGADGKSVVGVNGYAKGYNGTTGPTLATSVASGNGVVSSQARADLTYTFTLSQPLASGTLYTPGQQVALTIPLLMTYSGFTALDGNGQASVSLTVSDQTGTIFNAFGDCEGDSQFNCGAIGGDQEPFDLTWFYYGGGTTPPSISLTGEVQLHAYAALFNGTSAYAMIDPIITIDPTYLADHPDVTLSVQRVDLAADDPAAAPEPAGWAMMILGFGTIGAAVRRQRCRIAFA